MSKLAELFPERDMKTDYDAVKLVEELGDKALTELQKRLKEGETRRKGNSPAKGEGPAVRSVQLRFLRDLEP